MKKLLSGVVGIVLAVAFLAAGIFSIVTGVKQMNKIKSGKYVETQATITEIESYTVSDNDDLGGVHEEYTITVEYTVDGKKVVAQLNETPDEFYEGMELTVLYNVDKPTDNILPGSNGAYFLIGFGALAIIVSAVMIIKKLTGR